MISFPFIIFGSNIIFCFSVFFSPSCLSTIFGSCTDIPLPFFFPLIFFLIPYEISGLCSALKRFFKSFHFLFLCNSVLLGQCSQPFTGVAPLLSHVASPGLSLPGEGGHGRKTVFGYPRAKCEFRLH